MVAARQVSLSSDNSYYRLARKVTIMTYFNHTTYKIIIMTFFYRLAHKITIMTYFNNHYISLYNYHLLLLASRDECPGS